MVKYFYYYKRNSGEWVFENEKILKDREAIELLLKKRKEGYTTWRLYLDLKEDFERIKSIFFNPEYWENTTWEEEAER